MADVTIGRLRGGLCAIWYDERGQRKRHQLKARTRKEAESEALAVYRREALKSADRSVTVADIWQTYIDDLGDKTTATTMGYTGKAVLPHFGAYRPDQISKSLCLEYATLRMDEGLAQGTVWTELGHLQSALNFAAHCRIIDRPPKIWRPAKPQKDKRILSPDEARALINAAQAPHTRLALILCLGTAARIGALLDLEWERVDFERGSINLRLDDGQTRKGRAVVPMNAGVRQALQEAHEAALSDFVIEYAGGPVKSIRTGFVAAVRRSGVGHVRIHDLRHTAAVTMLSNGIPLEKVSQVLGHSNTAVTFSTYGRYLPEHMQDALDVLDFTSPE